MLKTLLCSSSSSRRVVPARHEPCGIPLRFLAAAVLFCGLATAAIAPLPLPLRVANTTAAAGGTAQIQIFLAAPATLTFGELSLDLDPKTFGPILSADVFSATGDQLGSANIQGQHLDVTFRSPTGGIGRLPNLPVLVVSAPVLLNAPASAQVSVQSSATWTDAQGFQYSAVRSPGIISIQGSLSVSAITPGGGALPQGATIRLDGTGFSTAATVQIDGVSLASTQFVNPQQLNLTLGAATDLSSRRVTVQNPGAPLVTYYSALHGTVFHRPTSAALATVRPIFPQQLYAAANAGIFTGSLETVALQNPTRASVDVAIETVSGIPPTVRSTVTITLPPDSIYMETGSALGGGPATIIQLVPATPIQMVLLGSGDAGLVTPIPVPPNVVVRSPLPAATSAQGLEFSVPAGQSAPVTQLFGVSPDLPPFTLAVQTDDGANWLSTSAGFVPQSFRVTITPANLAAATYHGTITLTSAIAVVHYSVTLTVWSSPPPPVTVSAPRLSFTAMSGGAQVFQTVSVATGDVPIDFSVFATTTEGDSWLSGSPAQSVPEPQATAITPSTAIIGASPASLPPGTYNGTVTFAAPPGSANVTTIPVTFTVTPAPPPLPQQGAIPLVSTILNAASQSAGSLSPGEILTLFGQNIGPATPAYFALDSTGKAATTLGGAQVLFDGPPAPLIYASATQINAIVPWEVAGQSVTNIAVIFNNTSIPAGGVPLADAAPAIFALNSTGVGGAAILNQDNSINTPTNPAARGSTVQIFSTGQGLTSPPGVTGEITALPLHRPLLPVHVQIGGIDAPVYDAVSASGEISGLFQVNATVPAAAPSGSSVPLTIQIGIIPSTSAVTIAIK